MKKRLIFHSILLFSLLTLLIAASFAWFISFNNQIENILVTTGNIQMSAKLYQMSDFNLDGILDVDENGNNIATEISSINISNMNPGEQYTYRLDVTNAGNIDGSLSLTLSDFSGSLSDVLYIDVINPSGVQKKFLYNFTQNLLIFDKFSLIINETDNILFKIKFATVSELNNNSIPFNNSLEGLNYYKSKQLNISKLTLTLTQ